jgi:DNA-binding SARP family transcriptional activator/TolB-like protein
MALRLTLLGGARVELDGKPVTGRGTQRRRLAILILLARAKRRTLTRERVASFLWPDGSSEAVRRLLSEAIYVIRRELGENVLATVGDEISLSPDVGCDVDDYLGALATGDRVRAVDLYRGAFLDAWYVRDAPDFERWAEHERVELASSYLEALRALTEEREAANDWAWAAKGWQAIVRLDPYSSTAVLRAARALIATGEPPAALQLLNAHEARLRDELGVGPDAELIALARNIRDGRVRPRRPDVSQEPSTQSDVPANAILARTDGAATSASWQSDERLATLVRPRRRIVTLVGFAAAILVSVWATGTAFWARATTATEHRSRDALDPLRVAVLYFEHNATDSTLRYLADGLTEALIRELADVPALHVLSRDAVARYRDGRTPADSIGKLLGAGTVIGADVQESAGRVRVIARLVDAATSRQVATVLVEQPRGELFALEDSLAIRTAAALRRRLGDAIRLGNHVSAASAGRRDDRALELVLRAERLRKDAELARTTSHAGADAIAGARERLRDADSLLAIAESRDPTWALLSLERGWVSVAAAGLEHGAARLVALAPGLGHVERAFATLREHAPEDRRTRALAHYLRGLLGVRTATAVQTFRPEAEFLVRAEADLDSAVTFDSTLAGAWGALSMTRWVRGDFDGSEKAAQHALAADAFLEDAGEVLGWAWRSAYAKGDRESATRWCRRGRTLLPEDWHFIECELTILRLDAAGLSGQRPDAARAWALVRELEAADPPHRARLMGRPYSPIYRRLVAAALSAAAGQRDTARAMLSAELARVRGDSELSTDILYDAAFLYTMLGDSSRATDALATYIRARPDLAAMIRRDPTMQVARRGIR